MTDRQHRNTSLTRRQTQDPVHLLFVEGANPTGVQTELSCDQHDVGDQRSRVLNAVKVSSPVTVT
jgi:hypothetical protein